ncbi:MAG: hypothetical protein Fur0043_17820 [Anaerolineales bacterium]
MEILLFDMDGVLLEAHAYHDALQDTVNLAGKMLGFEGTLLSMEDIAAFESLGVTSEWDSAAICVALLLDARWQIDPQARLPNNLRSSLPSCALHRPDFCSFIAALNVTTDSKSPWECAWQHLQETREYNLQQEAEMKRLLLGARQIDRSPTMRLFQELVLGSRVFTQIYDLLPQLDAPGYLEARDIPTLDAINRTRLLAWLESPGHHAAVMTNRPGRWPDDSQGSPEAEAGLRLTGLERLPMVHWGSLEWLAARLGVDNPQRLCKPAASHALAALRLAIGDQPYDALEAATALTNGRLLPEWKQLDGSRVTIFEDSENGLRSLLRAADLLAAHGIRIVPRLIGITPSPLKQRVLSDLQAVCYPNLSAALESVL